DGLPIHPDDSAMLEEARRKYEEGEPFQSFSFRIMHPSDGNVRWVSVQRKMFYDEKNQIIRITGVVQDITEQRQLEEQFHQSQKLEAIGILAGGVAHDFNNLLTVITGYSDVVRRSSHLDDRLHLHIDEIIKASDRTSALTQQLLAFSRRQTIQPRILDLNQEISDHVRKLRRLIGEDIELITTLASSLPAIKFDPGQADQLLVNLAVNARDAMPDGGMLTITTATVTLDEAFRR
ncbi:MAG: histidine kinase dimerization/phospho-acceptor domain-containing protein, partial [Gemmatimonadota bacterium]|nr:histidine kinase dimerization/phospho-acceptor domain-containing protein [Gemmatimonadota bacterium]